MYGPNFKCFDLVLTKTILTLFFYQTQQLDCVDPQKHFFVVQQFVKEDTKYKVDNNM